MDLHSHTVSDSATASPPAAKIDSDVFFGSIGKENDITIIGFDGQDSGKKAIKEGKIYADPIQHPDRMGRETVSAIMAYFKGEKVEPETLIPATLYRKSDAMADKSLK